MLRAAGDTFWVRRVIWNRGLAHAFRHEFAPAEADLRLAEQLAREQSLPLEVGFAQANLAFVLGLRGETAAAFAYSDAAEQRIREQDGRLGELLVDRAELLLSVRLVGEAREAAEQAVAEYARGRRDMKLPQARLVLAEAALLDGDAAAALPHARRAAREFGRQHRPEWAALARLLVLRATLPGRVRAEPRTSAPPLEVTRTLTAARWPSSALDARILDRDPAAPPRSARRGRRASARGRPHADRRTGDAARPRLVRRGPARATTRATREVPAPRSAPACGCSTSTAPCWAPSTCARTRPGTAPRWPSSGCASRCVRGVRATCWSGPSAAGRPGCSCSARAARRTTRRPRRCSPPCAGPSWRSTSCTAPAGARRPGRCWPGRRPWSGASASGRCTAAGRADPLAPPAAVDELAAALGDAGLLELVDADGTLIAITLAAGRVRLHRIGPDAGRRRPARPRRVRRLPAAAARPARRAARRGRHPAARQRRPGGRRAAAPDARARRPAAGRRADRVAAERAVGAPALVRGAAGHGLAVRDAVARRPLPARRARPRPGRRGPGAAGRRRGGAGRRGRARRRPRAGRRRDGRAGAGSARRRRPRPPGHARPPRPAQPAVLRAHCWPTGRCSPTTSSSSPPPRTPSCWPRARAGGPWCARATSSSAWARCSWPAGRASSWRPRCPSRTPRPRR